MIKLLDIIEEGTLTLTPEERQQLETIIPEIIEIIKTKNIPSSGQVWSAGKISYIYSDGEKGEVEIGVGAIDKNAKGQFSTYDKNNRTDNWIFINQIYFKQFFPGPNSFQDFDQRLYKTVTGNENTGIERLRQTLKHELIHAKDPALNHHYLKQAYDPNDEAIYYKSWAEFQTFTGQFFESLITGTDRVLNTTNNPGDIKRIEKALSNILQYFAGKTKIISTETKEFIDGTGSRKFFQKIFNFVSQIIRTPSDSDYALPEYLEYLSKIKQHNPEGYKEFLKDLYKTIKSIEEKVNSISNTKIKIQEMKSNINEIIRMQQLAGILNEGEYRKKLEETVLEGEDKNLVTDPRILALAAKITKQSVDKVEDKVDAALTGKEENKEKVNEALAITLALALPMILEAGGSIAGWVNKKFGLSKEELEEYKKWEIEYNNLKKKIESYTNLKLTDPKTKRYVDNKKVELAKMKEIGSKKFGGKISKFLKEAGHSLHHLYTSPIRALLWTISLFAPEGSDLKDPKIREKIANIIYAVGMMVFAGYGVYSSVKHLIGVTEAATAIIDGVKGGKSVSEIVTDVPIVVKAFST